MLCFRAQNWKIYYKIPILSLSRFVFYSCKNSETILSNLTLEMNRLSTERDRQYLVNGPIPRKFKLQHTLFTDSIYNFLSISQNLSFSQLLHYATHVSASLKFLEHEQVPLIFQNIYLSIFAGIPAHFIIISLRQGYFTMALS